MGERDTNTDLARARERRRQGWALQRIADEVGVAKSTVSVWVREVVPEVPVERRTPSRPEVHPMTAKRDVEVAACRDEAAAWLAEYPLDDRDLMMWGLALYLGEGAKTEHVGLQLANTDPRVIAGCMHWAERCFDVQRDQWRAVLYLHDDLDLDAALSFWYGTTGIAPDRFTKPYRAAPSGGRKTARHENGCLSIKVHSRLLHRRVMAMSEAVASSVAIRGSSAGRARDC